MTALGVDMGADTLGRRIYRKLTSVPSWALWIIVVIWTTGLFDIVWDAGSAIGGAVFKFLVTLAG